MHLNFSKKSTPAETEAQEVDVKICGSTHETTLDKLPVGATAKIVKIMPELRGRKKFADIGLVPGTELQMEAHAPFGGLLRVKVMETSMALHRDDAHEIVMEEAL